MLDLRAVEKLTDSPQVQATLVLVAIALLVQWYFSIPPKPKFPKAELDTKDWHGSFMKARSKVCHHPENPDCHANRELDRL